MVIPVRARQALLAVLLLSVALRVAVALHYGNWVPAGQDDHSYSQLAWRLARGHGYSFDRAWYPFTPAETPTAHWSFLYTALVAGVYRIAGYRPLAARLVNATATGLLLPWAVYRVTHRTFPERSSAAAIAAVGAAGYAYFVLYGARIMTEGLYMIALLWSLDSALSVADDIRRGDGVPVHHSFQLGLSLSVATLLRQAILPWVPVILLWLAWQALSSRWSVAGERRRVRQGLSQVRNGLLPLAVAGAVLMAFILPWTLRNYRVYDSFLLLNSNTGYAMYSAQHPMHGTDFQAHEAAPLPDDLLQGSWLTEPEWDRALMERGIGFVVAEPARYIRLSASRALSFIVFWPTHDTPLVNNVGRLVSFTVCLPFMVYGSLLALMEARRASQTALDLLRWPAVLLLGFVCFYALLHILTWAMPRYRVPVDAVMMPFAAIAVLDLCDRIRGRVRWVPWVLRTIATEDVGD